MSLIDVSRLRSFLLCTSVAAMGVVCGCSVPQSEECEKYVACAAHTDVVFDLTQTNTDAYAPEGSCWKDAETADRCTAACEEAVADLQQALDLSVEPRGDCG